MLVLSRKNGERILIGEDIAITVVRIGPNTVKIGIDAPKGIGIVREEVALRAASSNLPPEGSHGYAITGIEDGSSSGAGRHSG